MCHLLLPLAFLLLLALFEPTHPAAVPFSSTSFREPSHKSRSSISPAFIRTTEVIPSTGRFASVPAFRSKPSESAFFSRRLFSALSHQRSTLATEPADDYFSSESGDFVAENVPGYAVSRAEVEGDGEDGGNYQDATEDGQGEGDPPSAAEVPEPPQPHEDDEQYEREGIALHIQKLAELEQSDEHGAVENGAVKMSSPVDESKTIRTISENIENEASQAAPEVDFDMRTIRAASSDDSDDQRHAPPRAVQKKQKQAKADRSSSGGGGRGGSGGSVGGHFKGIALGVVDGTNVTHLSYMVFKLIKSYNIKSVVDIPCRNTLGWFPELLHRIDFEVVGFKYYCVDSEAHSQDDIRSLFTDAGSPEFLHIRPEEAHLLPKTDLVFSWDGPQQWGVKKTWSFFTALREIRPTYLMVTNNPKVANRNEQRGTINLRKQPFHVSYPFVYASSPVLTQLGNLLLLPLHTDFT